MSSSCCTLHPLSNRMLIDISDAWESPVTVCAHFSFYVMTEMSRLHVCVDLSFYPFARLTEIGLIAGLTLFTGVPGRKKFPVALVSVMASCLGIFIIDVDYAVSICLLVLLLMVIFLFSSS